MRYREILFRFPIEILLCLLPEVFLPILFAYIPFAFGVLL